MRKTNPISSPEGPPRAWAGPTVQNEPDFGGSPAGVRARIVQNEPNSWQRRVGRGPRGAGRGANVRNEANLGRSFKFEVSSIKTGKVVVGASDFKLQTSNLAAGRTRHRPSAAIALSLSGQ
jgi:hypothetical protein